MGGVASAAPIASPCTGICRLDPVTARCLGCGRTIDQIAAWPTMSEAERMRAMTALGRGG